MKQLLLIILFSTAIFGQTGKSVLTQAQKDSIGQIVQDSLLNNGYYTQKDTLPFSDNQYSNFNIAGDVSISSFVPTAYPNNGQLPPIITFITDGHEDVIWDAADKGNGFEGYRDIFNDRNVPLGISLTGYYYGTNSKMTVAQLLTMQSEGHELMSHINYTTEGSTADRLDDDFDSALVKLTLRKYNHTNSGFIVNNANWYGGVSTPAYRSAARQLYRSVRGVGIGLNDYPIDQYRLESYFMDDQNYNNWVTLVDSAISSGRWLILFGHFSYDDYFIKYNDNGELDAGGDYGWQKVGRIIDYIKAKPNYGEAGYVNILTVDSALDYYANIIDAGDRVTGETGFDLSKPYFRVSKTGVASSDKLDRMTIDTLNSFFGYLSGQSSSGTTNTFLGGRNGQSSSGDYNTFMGYRTAEGLTGSNNISIGFQTAYGANLANSVTIGYQSGYEGSGSDNVNIGYRAGFQDSSSNQTSIGNYAGQNNKGAVQTAVGYNAGISNTATGQTVVGYNAGANNTGIRNTAIGRESSSGNTGNEVVSIGYQSAKGNTANDVIALGYESGETNTETGVFLVEQRNLVAANPLIKGYFTSGGIVLGAPTTAVADALIGVNRLTFYVDEGNNLLKIKVKYSNGTVKTASIALE